MGFYYHLMNKRNYKRTQILQLAALLPLIIIISQSKKEKKRNPYEYSRIFKIVIWFVFKC